MAKIQHKLLYLFLSFVTLYFIVLLSVFVLISSVGICLFGAMDQAASSAISISDWQLIRSQSRLVSTMPPFILLAFVCIQFNPCYRSITPFWTFDWIISSWAVLLLHMPHGPRLSGNPSWAEAGHRYGEQIQSRALEINICPQDH